MRLNWVDAHPNGDLLAIGTDKGLLLHFQTENRTKKVDLATKPVYAARWTPDGQRLLVAQRDGKVLVLNGDGTEELGQVNTKLGQIYGMALDTEGRRFAVVGQKGGVAVRDVESLETTFEVPGTKTKTGELISTTAVAFAGAIPIVGSGLGQFSAYDDPQQPPIGGPLFAGSTSSAAATPSGDVIVLGGSRGMCVAISGNPHWKNLQVWKQDPPKPIATNSLCFAPDGKRFVAACSDGAARLFRDIQNVLPQSLGEVFWMKRPKPEWTPNFILSSACFSRDGQRIYTSGFNGKIEVWDAPDDYARKLHEFTPAA